MIKRKKISKKTKIILFLAIILVILVLLDIRLRPIIKSIMADKARYVAVNAIDNAVTENLVRKISNIQILFRSNVPKKASYWELLLMFKK